MSPEEIEYRLYRPDRADDPWDEPDGGSTALSWT